MVFCEARLLNGRDDEPHHLVYKRSADGGRTWGTLHYLEESSGGRCYMNPTPVLDNLTGRLHVQYALADGSHGTRVFTRSSPDHGAHWSAAVELTHLFADDPAGRSYHLPGPGHGIQMQSGRLTVPFWHRRPLKTPTATGAWETVPAGQRAYAVNVVFSDDGGTCWRCGEYVPHDQADMAHCLNEANIVETPEGLALLARTMDAPSLPYRYRCISHDGGAHFSGLHAVHGMENGVQCFTGLASVGGGYVLARPDHPQYPRRALTLYRSGDTKVWKRDILLEEGFGAYSDIVPMPQSRLLVLYVGTQYNDTVGKTIQCVLLDKLLPDRDEENDGQ